MDHPVRPETDPSAPSAHRAAPHAAASLDNVAAPPELGAPRRQGSRRRADATVAGRISSANAPQRWAREAQFFDAVADRMGELEPLSAAVKARYVNQPRRIYNKEFRFRLVGDLHGMRVLDLGCGDGANAALLGHCGAQVEGIDVSSRHIDLARTRAELEGLSSQLHFECAPVEQVSFPDESFDVIWGDGVLHHLIDVLEPTFTQLVRWARPNALFVFSEPVGLSPALRGLRGRLPIHTDATPDERPLQRREIELVRRFLPELRTRSFHLLGWLDRWVLPGLDYERATPWRRGLSEALHAADFALLGRPRMAALGGMAVLWGRVDK